MPLYYTDLLGGADWISTPDTRQDASHIFHQYVIRITQRDGLSSFLREKGIETGIHYPVALPFLKAYKYLGHKTSEFPVAYEYQQTILSLPMYPELTGAMIEYIAQSVKDFKNVRAPGSQGIL